VVDLAGRVLVLGVADSGINLITEVTSRDEIDRIRLLGSRTKPMPEGGFQEYIRQQIGKVVDKINEKRNHGARSARASAYDRPKEEEGVDLDYLQQQKSRLKDLNRYGDE
jgi:flagellar protein FliO/FliZ